jgi:hypothetical protein
MCPKSFSNVVSLPPATTRQEKSTLSNQSKEINGHCQPVTITIRFSDEIIYVFVQPKLIFLPN